MSINLHSPFLGVPFHSSINGRRKCNVICLDRRSLAKRGCHNCISGNQNHWLSQGIKFSHVCGRNLKELWHRFTPKSVLTINGIKEPFAQSKGFVNSFSPLLKEGLLLIRCSVYVAVVSWVCLLAWYGQAKAKGFVESKLLPSVCSILGEYIQRELDFGKVTRVTPLSVTLESCSIGPHREEFSCGEVPTLKLCVRPFASLRKGKFVIDAVLSHPTLLITQKADYSWLGIPSTESGLRRHLSTEEAIDHRTRTRRIAREEAAACWAEKRNNAAREAAEKGYIVSDHPSNTFGVDVLKQDATDLQFFFGLDEKMSGKNHHRMDTNVKYDLKHADLEKSFGTKIPGSALKFWSKIRSRLKKREFRRKPNGKDVSGISMITFKRRVLIRSALAAVAHFQSLNFGLNEALDIGGERNNDAAHGDSIRIQPTMDNKDRGSRTTELNFLHDPFVTTANRLTRLIKFNEKIVGVSNVSGVAKTGGQNVNSADLGATGVSNATSGNGSSRLQSELLESLDDIESQRHSISPASTFLKPESSFNKHQSFSVWQLGFKPGLPLLNRNLRELLSCFLAGFVQRPKSGTCWRNEDIVAEIVGVDEVQTYDRGQLLPVILDSVHFKGGTLMLLAYGDREPREMQNVDGCVKFQNHDGHVRVQLSGNCNMWRSGVISEDGGWFSADVFVDRIEQKWHANLKVSNIFAPLFERVLEIPIIWSKGRASGEVHICMSRGETFPNLYGQLDVSGLVFRIYDAPSWFSGISASLCFRGQRIFLYNTSGWFGEVPLEASGDFGIHPEEGEFHLMCQVPHVEVNALMKSFKMKPLLFPLAGSVTAVFNCQGPLDTPMFVGSGMISRKITDSASAMPASSAYEILVKNKEAGAVAVFDRVPLSYLSANFTLNVDNCVADLYGIRTSLVDGGEIRGAGNAWICPEGEVDDGAVDVNFSGNLSFERILCRYLPGYDFMFPNKLGDLNGEAKLSGSLLKPRFDVKWAAPKADGSLSDARGDIIISHDYIIINSSSVAFEMYTKVQMSCPDESWLEEHVMKTPAPFTVEGVELDLRMRGFEFISLVSSYSFDSPRPIHLKASGKVKFQGKVIAPSRKTNEKDNALPQSLQDVQIKDDKSFYSLVGDVSISAFKLNQLMLAPQLSGTVNISRTSLKLDATGRPDESLTLEVAGPLDPCVEENVHNGTLVSFSLQRGQLRANFCYRPLHSAKLEIRHLPLDELELASLRGTIQRAELQLNMQKRRGHGGLSVLRPKFSGILGEALDVAARWSGDVITIEKTILEQAISRYELQGEYVLPGTRERKPIAEVKAGLFQKAMTGHLGSVISSMGRWRMRLEVRQAEVTEMLPLARLLSRSTDPAVLSRSKDFFLQSLQSVGLYAESLQDLLEVIRGHATPSDEVILEDLTLPGLAELGGRWQGSLDASGGGNGDTVAEFDFRGENWEWGAYKTQHVLATGAYNNDDGLRLEKFFIQKENATVHADGTLLGPKNNLHFAFLNFPVSLVPTVIQIAESSSIDSVHSLRQILAPIKGILHMEGDLRGSLEKPECDVQVRLLDGAIGGIDLGRAEIVASLTSSSRFLFNANFEPITQNGHVHIQGSIPVTPVQSNLLEEEKTEVDRSGSTWIPGWIKERGRGFVDEGSDKKVMRDRNEEGWDTMLAEGLKSLNWNMLNAGEVRIDTDIKDGGMMLLTALSPYADWLHGNADIVLQVRGTVDQPVLDGSASFHRASISSPILRKPLTNIGGSIHVKSNRLCISSLQSRVSRRGKLSVKGNLPLRISEASAGDKIDLKCELLEVRAKNILSGQVDTQMQVSGSILQPNISGKIKLSHGEAYLPHDKGNGSVSVASNQPGLTVGGINQGVASRYVSHFFSSEPLVSKFSQPSVKQAEADKELAKVNIKPELDVHLTDLKLVLGPGLRIVYPLILNFSVSGELELNGVAHFKLIEPKGVLTFENGDVNLVATQVRLKREHLNVAKFEPDDGLDPMLDLVLVGSEWQFRIQSRASQWQDNLVVTSTRSVEQDPMSTTEAARIFQSQLAESILEGDGQLALKKLATATVETLMPRIEGKGEFGQARWRLVSAPQIPSLLSIDPTVDPLKSLASNISFGTEVEVQLGKRLQASIVRQMKDSEMAMQWTLIYQLTSRLRVLLQSAPSKRLLFEYSATSQN